ncbi:Cytochrome P450 monooxygenase BOA3 [Fusarium oxysporum f. sp. cubense]|uniref:Cytochrome P450 monooxygenase BOA3 n=1 Tax=Fusarium oxysporum f. sp. cubense TaxID=61366 RepID=A0A559LH89_FUSOC|nr:Cytochrome P450 monooxygenase BOA3 [Fusarium oxysporum f. sp. cubense]
MAYSILKGLLYIATIGSIWIVLLFIYRLFLHPLARYPGPRLAACSQLWFIQAWTGGRYHPQPLFRHNPSFGKQNKKATTKNQQLHLHRT